LRLLCVLCGREQKAEQLRPTNKKSPLSFDDPAVFDVIGKADTVTLCQVESRAQMQRLPLTQPRNLEELAVQIPII
jgi:DNA polymerase III alpha subunit